MTNRQQMPAGIEIFLVNLKKKIKIDFKKFYDVDELHKYKFQSAIAELLIYTNGIDEIFIPRNGLRSKKLRKTMN